MPKNTAPLVQLMRHDLLWVTQRLPRNVRELMKKHGPSAILAGGFIRACVANERPADIDLFTSSVPYAQALANELAGGDRKRIHETDNAFTVSAKPIAIQIIHRWTFENPRDVVSSFDFTIASAAAWWEPSTDPQTPSKGKWESWVDPEFYSDLAGKRIVYRQPKRVEDAGGSLLRVLKFYQRGYRIPLDSLGEIVARLVAAVDMEAMGVMTEVIGLSKEEAIGRVLTGLLREVDPNLDPDHIAHLPSDTQPEEQDAQADTAQP